MIHEKGYSRYSDRIVCISANTVYIQMSLNTHEPMIRITNGTKVFPSPREAAMLQSMSAVKQNDQPITLILFMPASMTACSVVKTDRNSLSRK